MKTNTKDKLLEQAEILFAQKGFYGTSINDVAFKVEVSKQGLLHHFPSKEKLYGAVLKKAADQLMASVQQSKERHAHAIDQICDVFQRMSTADESTLRVIILLLRELLDNRDRAQNANKWYLRPFLDELAALVVTAQQQGYFKDTHPLAFIYQILGSTQYYLISQPTLRKLYSEQEFVEHQQQHLRLLDKTLRQT